MLHLVRPARVAPPTAGSRAGRLVVFGAVVLGMLLALSGCLGYQGDLQVGSDDTVSGTIVVYKSVPDTSAGTSVAPLPIPIPQPPAPESAGASSSASLDLPAPKPTSDSITVAPYKQDAKVGWTYTYAGTTFAEAAGFAPLAGRGGALKLTRQGDVVTLAADFDLTYGTLSAEQGELIKQNFSGTVTLRFPGQVSASNGTVSDGRTVTWTLVPLQTNSLTATVEYPKTGAGSSAGASAGSTPPTGSLASPSWLARTVVGVPAWTLLVAAAVLLLALAAVLVGASRRRARRRSTPPEPYAAAPTEPPAPGPDRPVGRPVASTWTPPPTSSDTMQVDTSDAAWRQPAVPTGAAAAALVEPQPEPQPQPPAPPSSAAPPPPSESEGTRPSFGPPPLAAPIAGEPSPAEPPKADAPDRTDAPVPVGPAGWPPPQPHWVDPQED